MNKRTTIPYWLNDGTELCPACTHLHVYETVLRCTGCDRAVCPHCAVVHTVQRITWCPECRAEEQEA